MPDCIFCNVNVERGFKLVHEDERLVIFWDRRPASQIHLLAVPKQHIRLSPPSILAADRLLHRAANVKSLTASHLPLIETLEQAGRRALNSLGVDDKQQLLGFHIPPFYSVDHLHMHLLSVPLSSAIANLKYRPSKPKGKLKGFAWFITSTQLKTVLQSDRRVRVGSIRP